MNIEIKNQTIFNYDMIDITFAREQGGHYATHRFYAKGESPTRVVYELRQIADQIERRYFGQ